MLFDILFSMENIDLNILPLDLVIDERVIALAGNETECMLVTDRAISQKGAEMLSFSLGGKKIKLESVQDHPDVLPIFDATIEQCRQLLTSAKSYISGSAEEKSSRHVEYKKRTE
jgi:hypothetical protein